ncbi:hypothetical protein GDO81_020704 [Engystomops pustulosus]|uniref:Uncharacterized protein n=1 Tax=Engystomops pustulosus TaxID=76066 RepID=A0AAV6YWV1_ENGPU|nr:hypothetical protein GDO81_020704 [Engystomops pustulosus]
MPNRPVRKIWRSPCRVLVLAKPAKSRVAAGTSSPIKLSLSPSSFSFWLSSSSANLILQTISMGIGKQVFRETGFTGSSKPRPPRYVPDHSKSKTVL